MTIGKMISETRKNSGLTQQQYGDKFCVTRQTVSSWENEKSYPDLQTLISICDEFNMSLDKLLREDKNMVEKIDHSTVMLKAFKTGIKVCGFLLSLFVIYMVVWYGYKVQSEKQFVKTMSDEGFELQEGIYVLKENGIIYTVPNQKLPLFNFHFFNSTMQVKYFLEDELYLHILSIESLSISANNDNDISFTLDNAGKVKQNEKLNEEETLLYVQYSDEISKMVDSGLALYERIYE